MRMFALLACMVLLPSPAVGASTPENLVQEMSRAAHDGDVDGFLSVMSADTRRVIADVEAARSNLANAQKDFVIALDARFGATPVGGGSRFPAVDRKSLLSRFVDISLISVEQQTPNRTQLRLKTVSKDFGDRAVSKEETVTAIEENGEWKLDLTDSIRWLTRMATQRAVAYGQVTHDIQSNVFKSRFSAMMALEKARRGHVGGEDK